VQDAQNLFLALAGRSRHGADCAGNRPIFSLDNLAIHLLIVVSYRTTDLSWRGIRTPTRRRLMAKIWAALLVIASFLMLAPVMESGTSESTQFFQAIGNAEGGGS